MTLSPGARLGPYEIVALLGAGGMGEVWRARDARLGRDVAIKALPRHLAATPESRARFEREARAVSQLAHPHICVLHDVGRQGEIDYLVLELVEGESLAARLAKGPLPLEQALRLGVEVADALASAHRAGIVHRDLKPGNIMLTKSGAKLMDFGLARASRAGPAPGATSMTPTISQPLTAQGSLVGTFQYMAPEQLEGKEADHRADLWALGATLYEAASGKRAFEGESQASLIGAIMRAEPRPLSELQPLSPPAFERAVRQCLAKEPDDRWQSAADLKRELQWILEAGSRAGVPTPVTRRRVSRERLAWAAALVSTAGLLAALTVGRAGREPGLAVLAIPPLAGLTLSPDFCENAISPDGGSVAFTATDSAGQSHLYLRRIDAREPVPVPESRGAHMPFWSPDSRFVAFFDQQRGKLLKVPVAGGPPVVICDSRWARGGTWSKDGTIVFAPAPNGPLHRVPASGGESVPVTTLDSTRGESGHRLPWFLPDGDHFLFVAMPGRGSTYDIFVGSLRERKVERVLQAASAATYAEPGYLLFERDGKVMAQRFDSRRRRLTKEAVPIEQAPAPGQTTGGWVAVASRSGRLLTYRSKLPETNLRWFDRSGAVRGTVPLRSGSYGEPRISPDGRRAAVTSVYSASQYDLEIIDLARSVSTRIGQPGTYTFAPVWSPDGRRIAFSSNRSGREEIYLQDADGGGDAELAATTGAMFKSPQAWSPDGRWLVLQELSIDRQFDVLARPMAGDASLAPVARSSGNDQGGRLSPDGLWLAYESESSGRTEVFLQRFPGGEDRIQVSTSGGESPRWWPSGREILFVGGDGALFAVPVDLGSPPRVGEAVRLFQPPEGSTGYDVAPDGRIFATVPSGRGEQPTLTVVMGWDRLHRR